MTHQHDPKKRINRQRDSRRQERQQDRHTSNATLRDAVRAIGAGDADDWNYQGDIGPDLIGTMGE